MPGSGTWTVPGFTHVRELGAGASGRVVLAVRNATGHRVAIKYLAPRLLGDARFLARFRAEARTLAGLTDPHVVGVFDYVETDSGAAIVMELVNGVSLRAVLSARGRLDTEAALVLLKGSLQGLATAHAAGVVHRDYKPENVLVPVDGASRLVDFGIAVPAGADTPYAGTPPYMAPEQWTGATVSPASDVYAATVVFFECLTGAVPFHAATLPDWANAHRGAAIPVAAVPEAVRSLITAGMAKSPEQRPGSAAAFTQQFEAAARAAYGPDWEARGRRALAVAVAGLAALLPFGLAHGSLTPATTPPAMASGQVHAPTRRSLLRRLRGKLTTRTGVAVTAGAAAAIVVLGAGGVVLTRDGDTTSEAPDDIHTTAAAASPTPSASPTPAGPTLPKPVCARMNLKRVGEIFNHRAVWDKEQSSFVGTPSLDTCVIRIVQGDTRPGLAFGVSVLPADKQRLATLRQAYERTQGQFVDVRTVNGVGNGGYGTDRFVLVLTHGRLLKVSGGMPRGQTFERLRKAAKAAAPYVGKVRDTPAKITLGTCKQLTPLAERALGSAPVVRRDGAADEDQGLSCGWATRKEAVSVSGSRIQNAKQAYKDNVEVSIDPQPLDVGDEGIYDPESTSALYRVGEHLIVHVTYTPFGEGKKNAMIALTKASEPLYR